MAKKLKGKPLSQVILDTEKQAENRKGLTASLLYYDIPDTSEFPNPSPILRRFAVRSNLSVWIVPDDRIPYHLLNEMEIAGCSWQVIKFDASEAVKLINITLESLKKDVQQAMKRLETEKQVALDTVLSDEESGADVSVLTYYKRVKGLLRHAEQLVADYCEAAACFGIAPSCLNVNKACTAISSLSTSMKTRSLLFTEMTRLAESKGEAGKSMASAARADDVPAGILADFLEEQGEDITAAREAFAGV